MNAYIMNIIRLFRWYKHIQTIKTAWKPAPGLATFWPRAVAMAFGCGQMGSTLMGPLQKS